MSNVGLSMQETPSGGDPQPQKTKKKRRRQKGRSGAVIVVSLLVLLGAGAVVGYFGYQLLGRVQASAPVADYPGPGEGEVVIEVLKGETLTDIGVTLADADVVASVAAFSNAALAEPDATGIMPGRYAMLQKMSGEGAVQRLLDPAASNINTVVIPEGLRTDQVVAILAKETSGSKKQFNKIIRDPTALPLPDWARGTGEARVEGFLFPATYEFDKQEKPKQILNVMVDKFNAVAEEIDFVNRAESLGYSPYEVLTVASLVQAEAPPEDFGKVSRVVYNRLEPETWGGTYGYLGFDSTVNYILKQSEINLTESDRAINSPYNTFTEKHQGLTPTPINNPGEAAMEAALEPPEGNWLYFVTTNPDTGKTKFTDDYNVFLGYQDEFEAWLRENQ